MKFYHQLVWEPLFCRFWPVVYDSDSSELLERQGYLIGADVTWRWSHWQLWGHWSGTCSKWFGSCYSLLKIYVIMIIVCIWKKNVQKHEFVLRWYQIIFQVAKQWYDFDRQTFTFVKILKEKKDPFYLNYQSDFDENGLIYWIGSNAK